MAALTSERMSLPYSFKNGSLVLKASTDVYKGGMACLDTAAAGSVTKGAAASTTLVRLGQFTETNLNSGSGSTSRVMVSMDQELLGQWYDNATGGAAVTAASLYGYAYILDDHTVTNSASGNSAAGTVWDLDAIKGVAIVKITRP